MRSISIVHIIYMDLWRTVIVLRSGVVGGSFGSARLHLVA
jgi:hypothetical protein